MDALRMPVGFCVDKSILCGPVAFYILRAGQLCYERVAYARWTLFIKKKAFLLNFDGVEWLVNLLGF